jgi:4-hydroxybenzoate polyprenyltransferase
MDKTEEIKQKINYTPNSKFDNVVLWMMNIFQVPGKYIYYTIKEVRINQWYKNLVIFAGVAFSGNLTNLKDDWMSVVGFICFCLISGVGYIINDITDRDKDATHEHKRNRPIASRRFPIKVALPIAIGLLIIALVGSLFIGYGFFLISIGYLALTLSYSFIWKKIVLLDVIVVAFGFVIRAIAGCIIVNTNVSNWLIVCSFLLALFLALNKRWYAFNVIKEQSAYSKSVLQFYSNAMLDKLINITTSSLLVSYIVYVTFTKKDLILVSAVFVVYGIFRYLYLVQHLNQQADPDKVLRDKGLLISMGCWIVCILMLSR